MFISELVSGFPEERKVINISQFISVEREKSKTKEANALKVGTIRVKFLLKNVINKNENESCTSIFSKHMHSKGFEFIKTRYNSSCFVFDFVGTTDRKKVSD